MADTNQCELIKCRCYVPSYNHTSEGIYKGPKTNFLKVCKLGKLIQKFRCNTQNCKCLNAGISLHWDKTAKCYQALKNEFPKCQLPNCICNGECETFRVGTYAMCQQSYKNYNDKKTCTYHNCVCKGNGEWIERYLVQNEQGINEYCHTLCAEARMQKEKYYTERNISTDLINLEIQLYNLKNNIV